MFNRVEVCHFIPPYTSFLTISQVQSRCSIASPIFLGQLHHTDAYVAYIAILVDGFAELTSDSGDGYIRCNLFLNIFMLLTTISMSSLKDLPILLPCSLPRTIYILFFSGIGFLVFIIIIFFLQVSLTVVGRTLRFSDIFEMTCL